PFPYRFPCSLASYNGNNGKHFPVNGSILGKEDISCKDLPSTTYIRRGCEKYLGHWVRSWACYRRDEVFRSYLHKKKLHTYFPYVFGPCYKAGNVFLWPLIPLAMQLVHFQLVRSRY